MKKVLWIGDGYSPTGFTRVNQSIIDRLSPDEYDIHHLAINYHGDPHPYPQKMYPATLGGDVWGYGRLERTFSSKDVDMIFILNDVWVIDKYLKIIKDKFERIPPIVVYFPVDSKEIDEAYFENFDIVNKTVVYTQFGYDEISKVYSGDIEIIPHGIDNDVFYEMDHQDIKEAVYGKDHRDSFIVLNANRNQPRKRLDIAIMGFCEFAKGKPDNVNYYHHAGIQDVGWDVIRLFERMGEQKRLILTNRSTGPQSIPEESLNAIYNATDVGLNTSTGEGWGLVQVEHAVTGAPQIVSNNSASAELFSDCGILLDTPYELYSVPQLTRHSVTTPFAVAEALEKLYTDEVLYKTLSEKGKEKFTSEKYNWDNIVKQWDALFKTL